MASEKDLELLDQYLGGKLNADDKAAFEKRLETDAELRSEFSLQQKVVEGIRNARVSELKRLLNDIPISSIPSEGMSLISKIGLLVAATALVGTGLYMYLNQQDKALIEPTRTETVNSQEPAITNVEKGVEPAQENSVQPAPAEIQEERQIVKPTPKTPVVEEESVAPAPLDVFDPTDESAKTEAQDLHLKGDKGEETGEPSILVETVADKKYNFHYQFRDNKLFLYGSFEKNLYEIMEFFSDNKRTMFLFYRENYYLLNEEDEKVKPLAPIKDPTLLQKLKDYRKN